ncbi:MAG: zinc ABC transporter substrate-binding protein [Sulfurospirillum sp.]|nr:zinc ABC transporter substrate-binding protein [Sulfurospirillum sp.]
MKKYFALFLCAFLGSASAQINAVVSILPQKAILQAITGDLVGNTLMIKAGENIHSYEPKPSQMIEISKADIYFSIGVEFENAWLEKFTNQNKKLVVVDVTKGIEKIDMLEHEHGHGHAHKESKGAISKDPHVWTSPKNIKIIAKNMLETLLQLDSKNSAVYEKNHAAFVQKVDALDTQIQTIFKSVAPHAKFMVFHPSWGYFAHQYNLEQLAIEVAGKEPKPKELAMILEEAKEENIKAIFAQPEFSDKSAKIIAEDLGIRVIKISPLSPDWEQTLINMANAIANR